MNLYPVRVEWIPGLPKIPYQRGVGAYEGVVMHHIGTDSESADAQRAYEVNTWDQAFVHEFNDYDDCLQVADPQYIAYGAGPNANKRFVHLELCSGDTQAKFEASFDRWCQRAAVHLAKRQLGVTPAQPDGSGTVWGHYDVTRYLGGTDHTDPIEYLQSWGVTWQDVLDCVKLHYDLITSGGDYMLKAEDANKIIQLLAGAYGTLAGYPTAQQEIHRLANELRKASGQKEE